MAFRCDYDYPFENVEWNEISRSQAEEIWKSYDTKKIPKRRCNVKTDNVGSQQIWKNCSIGGNSYKDAKINIIMFSFDATILPENFPENAKFYTTAQDSTLVRIKEIPEHGETGNNKYEDKIYKNGWLVESMTYRSYTDRTYIYVEY